MIHIDTAEVCQEIFNMTFAASGTRRESDMGKVMT
jgi:hypothetical protein